MIAKMFLPNSSAVSGSFTGFHLHDAKVEFKIDFEDGLNGRYSSDRWGSSVAVRREVNAVEYLGQGFAVRFYKL
jgi:hypothetical protein